jgi:hypothetical protein
MQMKIRMDLQQDRHQSGAAISALTALRLTPLLGVVSRGTPEEGGTDRSSRACAARRKEMLFFSARKTQEMKG